MYYTIYKITNKFNGKYYIGKHQTNNLDDGYMGSGKILRHAITKYGVECFSKEILHIFATEEEMNQKEKELVVIGEDSYNLCEGGKGGFSYINNNGITKMLGKPQTEFQKNCARIYMKNHPEKWVSKEIHKKNSEKMKNNTLWLGRKHTEETKQKISIKAKENSLGSKNSQYGTIWVTNGFDNMKVKNTDNIPEGWYKGRIFKKISAVLSI